MHNAAFAAVALDWRYVKLPVPPSLFVETVRALPGSGYRGANVTIPHKLSALEVADSATAAARVGAANTLTFAAEGAIEADNTDAGGFLDALGESPRGRRALVLGAGGAGRAVAWALREEGAGEVLIWNRTPERAEDLARELDLEAVPAPRSTEIVVNATSVGLDAVEPAEAVCALGLEPSTRRRSSLTSSTPSGRLRSSPGQSGSVPGWSTGSRCSCAREFVASSAGPARRHRWTSCAPPHAKAELLNFLGPCR